MRGGRLGGVSPSASSERSPRGPRAPSAARAPAGRSRGPKGHLLRGHLHLAVGGFPSLGFPISKAGVNCVPLQNWVGIQRIKRSQCRARAPRARSGRGALAGGGGSAATAPAPGTPASGLKPCPPHLPPEDPGAPTPEHPPHPPAPAPPPARHPEARPEMGVAGRTRPM